MISTKLSFIEISPVTEEISRYREIGVNGRRAGRTTREHNAFLSLLSGAQKADEQNKSESRHEVREFSSVDWENSVMGRALQCTCIYSTLNRGLDVKLPTL